MSVNIEPEPKQCSQCGDDIRIVMGDSDEYIKLSSHNPEEYPPGQEQWACCKEHAKQLLEEI